MSRLFRSHPIVLGSMLVFPFPLLTPRQQLSEWGALIDNHIGLYHNWEAKIFFTTLDRTDAYWQMEFKEASSRRSTFNTPFGRVSFKIITFGISSASEIFKKKIAKEKKKKKKKEITSKQRVKRPLKITIQRLRSYSTR